MTDADADADATPAELVREFHLTFGVPVADRPADDCTDPELAPRTGMLQSECDEAIAAHESGDIAALACELADVVYVAYGTAIALGIPLDEVIAEVHRANMSKLGADSKPILDANGKVVKGQNFIPPDAKPILRRHRARRPRTRAATRLAPAAG